MSAESNNNSLDRETGPAGEFETRAAILSHTHKPAGLVQITHLLKEIMAPQVLH